jgi:hypothetical protein
VAVSRARAGLLEAFARETGARRWHADWRDLVRDPEIEAVYVATPVHLHAEQTVVAAEAGAACGRWQWTRQIRSHDRRMPRAASALALHTIVTSTRR